ncbi:MAG: hypothetical protein ACJ71R_19210 [Nitrososphaeraceae archaeon]
MGENLSVGSACNIIDHITQLEVASQKQQRIPRFNIAIVMSALASLTAVSTTKKPMNKCNTNNSATFVFLFSLIALGLFSLSVSAIMVNAQASSSSSDNNRAGSGTDKQMGICVIGVESPCNGDM